ncbi:hypothetical protein BDV36DRAFT_291395 [Aspergillus pseudocaelatus]|uniref:NB-ARC domain-containing protein n=1 Tax=Aspergillus pseudocaelatus TaxID=1825620 RepID=A0ABQ6X365_9EURO|nr:hypothetical protein BDV36DRAFT_291395 [Aspergillus pseudocaelatus]
MSDGSKKLGITGLGGIVKTQVALKLAYRMRDEDAECSLFRIPCTSLEVVEQACTAIAQMVGIQNVKLEGTKHCIKAHFSEMDGKWLLIYDNADDIDMWNKSNGTILPLKDFLPYNDQGRIIFTIRNRRLAIQLAHSDGGTETQPKSFGFCQRRL